MFGNWDTPPRNTNAPEVLNCVAGSGYPPRVSSNTVVTPSNRPEMSSAEYTSTGEGKSIGVGDV